MRRYIKSGFCQNQSVRRIINKGCCKIKAVRRCINRGICQNKKIQYSVWLHPYRGAKNGMEILHENCERSPQYGLQNHPGHWRIHALSHLQNIIQWRVGIWRRLNKKDVEAIQWPDEDLINSLTFGFRDHAEETAKDCPESPHQTYSKQDQEEVNKICRQRNQKRMAMPTIPDPRIINFQSSTGKHLSMNGLNRRSANGLERIRLVSHGR